MKRIYILYCSNPIKDRSSIDSIYSDRKGAIEALIANGGLANEFYLIERQVDEQSWNEIAGCLIEKSNYIRRVGSKEC
jgi:hypothetical protein